MTEKQWLACTDPNAMLSYLDRVTHWPWRLFQVRRPTVSSQKLRLFACACCRCHLPDQGKPQFHQAVGIAERFADGLATAEQVRLANRLVIRPTGPLSEKIGDAWSAARDAMKQSVLHRSGDRPDWEAIRTILEQERESACLLLRDIFGNPFHPQPAIDPT